MSDDEIIGNLATAEAEGQEGERVSDKPRALDLFCGAGGAAVGLHRAGFDVIGIDIKKQPRYPFPFIQADALKPPVRLEDFDLVWASPPCQGYSTLRVMPNAGEHQLLVDAIRATISGRPYVIENVPGAPLQNPAVLCGSQFGLQSNGFQLRRHRLFETSFYVMWPECQHAERTMGVFGEKVRDIAAEKRHYRKDKATRGKPTGVVLPQGWGNDAMEIHWMNRAELSEAIPPAYAEHIGRYAMMALGRSEA